MFFYFNFYFFNYFIIFISIKLLSILEIKTGYRVPQLSDQVEGLNGLSPGQGNLTAEGTAQSPKASQAIEDMNKIRLR